MLLLVLFISLFTQGAVQEFGDIQQLLGFAFGEYSRTSVNNNIYFSPQSVVSNTRPLLRIIIIIHEGGHVGSHYRK